MRPRRLYLQDQDHAIRRPSYARAEDLPETLAADAGLKIPGAQLVFEEHIQYVHDEAIFRIACGTGDAWARTTSAARSL